MLAGCVNLWLSPARAAAPTEVAAAQAPSVCCSGCCRRAGPVGSSALSTSAPRACCLSSSLLALHSAAMSACACCSAVHSLAKWPMPPHLKQRRRLLCQPSRKSAPSPTCRMRGAARARKQHASARCEPGPARYTWPRPGHTHSAICCQPCLPCQPCACFRTLTHTWCCHDPSAKSGIQRKRAIGCRAGQGPSNSDSLSTQQPTHLEVDAHKVVAPTAVHTVCAAPALPMGAVTGRFAVWLGLSVEVNHIEAISGAVESGRWGC